MWSYPGNIINIKLSIIAKLKNEEKLQNALESTQVLSNNNKNNEFTKQKYKIREDKIIEKQTSTRLL